MTALTVGHLVLQALPAVSPWIIPVIAGHARASPRTAGSDRTVRLIARIVAVAAIGLALLAVGIARACDTVRADRAGIARDDSLLDFVTVRTERAAQLTDAALASETADRRAGRFLAFLAQTDPVAFRRMMDAVLVGCRFGDAVRTGYGADTEALWRRFMEGARD